MRLVQIQKITGVIHCETNLHIGGSKDDIEIGGWTTRSSGAMTESLHPRLVSEGVMRCSMEVDGQIISVNAKNLAIYAGYSALQKPKHALIVRRAYPDCRHNLQFTLSRTSPTSGSSTNMIDRIPVLQDSRAKRIRILRAVRAGARAAGLRQRRSNDFRFPGQGAQAHSERHRRIRQPGTGRSTEDLQRDGIRSPSTM